MRWFLSGFLVASLGIASQAQAETWSCSYFDVVKREAKPMVFIRNGKNFDVQGAPLTFEIKSEDSKIILLTKSVYDGKPPSDSTTYVWPLALYWGSLNKELKGFYMWCTTEPIGGENRPFLPAVTRTWEGNCVIH